MLRRRFWPKRPGQRSYLEGRAHDYLPFGEDTQPLTGDPMRFGGKQLDPESALYNFEARYYRNTWGRFTQVDPAGMTSETPRAGIATRMPGITP